jgi:DNA helicase HerA-like ATPase
MITSQNVAKVSLPGTLGHVLSVNGSRARLGLLAAARSELADKRMSVGRLVWLQCGASTVLGVLTELQTTANDPIHYALADVDLVGEITKTPSGALQFYRGVKSYPAIGDTAGLAGRAELQAIYQPSDGNTINIGQLQHDETIGAFLKVNEVISKHFAVLGTTGVGKSTAVATILQKLMEVRSDLRVLLIDVHNEYGECFGGRAQVLTPSNLKLPFWLFNFEEVLDVFFGGRPGAQEEIDILLELIPIAKATYVQYRGGGGTGSAPLRRVDPRRISYTADTPVPYRLADLLALIDERMGKLENRASRMIYHRLMSRIETLSSDPRYAFMFENANVGGDTMAEVLGQVFRIPANGVPITILQLAGFPSEVVDAVFSVLCRMAFDFGVWSDGAVPLLFVCEEAHRYAAADRTVGFGPTRRAISRIAKEGRKYGVFLGLVTQRPTELDPTILSQCSTLFAMRMSNEHDQTLLRSAIADSSANLHAFLPSLGTGEVLAFGEGVPIPTRLRISEPPNGLLRKRISMDTPKPTKGDIGAEFVATVLERWRAATMSKTEDGPSPPLQPAAPAAMPADGERNRLLKHPLDSRM